MAAFDELTFIVLISWQLSQKSQQGKNLLPKLLHFTFSEMIKAILIFNNHGKPRLNKFYQYYVSMLLITNFLCPGSFISHCHMLLYLANINDIFIVEFFIQINSSQIFFVHEVSLFQNEGQQQQIVKETFQLVSKRDDNVCNFLEGGR